MSDRAEEIMVELERVLAETGVRVERDRRFPEGEDELHDDGPLALLLTGEEETDPLEGEVETWAQRWIAKPQISLLLAEPDEAEQRRRIREWWLALLEGLEDSRLHDREGMGGLLARGTAPRVKRILRHPDETDLLGVDVLLSLTFRR